MAFDDDTLGRPVENKLSVEVAIPKLLEAALDDQPLARLQFSIYYLIHV